MSEILHVHCDSVKILPSEEASSSGHDLACFEEFEEFESGHLQDMSEEYFNVFLKPLADEQRLQQLREDFEEARNEHRKALRSRYTGTLYRDLCSYSTCGTVEDMANSADFDNYTQDVQKMIQAARRYIIARDFNVFDPERADMLWKLQNGGAQ